MLTLSTERALAYHSLCPASWFVLFKLCINIYFNLCTKLKHFRWNKPPRNYVALSHRLASAFHIRVLATIKRTSACGPAWGMMHILPCHTLENNLSTFRRTAPGVSTSPTANAWECHQPLWENRVFSSRWITRRLSSLVPAFCPLLSWVVFIVFFQICFRNLCFMVQNVPNADCLNPLKSEGFA